MLLQDSAVPSFNKVDTIGINRTVETAKLFCADAWELNAPCVATRKERAYISSNLDLLLAFSDDECKEVGEMAIYAIELCLEMLTELAEFGVTMYSAEELKKAHTLAKEHFVKKWEGESEVPNVREVHRVLVQSHIND